MSNAKEKIRDEVLDEFTPIDLQGAVKMIDLTIDKTAKAMLNDIRTRFEKYDTESSLRNFYFHDLGEIEKEWLKDDAK